MEGNPIRDRVDLGSKCIPLGFHGDEVPITGKGKCWCKSMLTFEWCSLLGQGLTCDRMFWVWGSFDKLLEEEVTLHVFWKVISWSFFWLQQGKWPTTDWNGNSYPVNSIEGQRAGSFLAGGYYAIIWAVMGDLDYLCKTLLLPRSTSSQPCCLCKCTLNGNLSWKNNSVDAEWCLSVWKPLDWCNWEDKSKCGLFSIPGVSAVTVALDWMHNKYLGIDQHQFGSVLYILCFMVLPDTPKENLAVCWSHIKSFYRSHNTANRYQNISKLSMFLKRSGVIKLRGKAGELKGLGPAIYDLWKAKMNPVLSVHTKIELLLKLNCKLEDTLSFYSDEIKLPAPAAKRCDEYAMALLQLQLELNQHFLEDDACTKVLFSLTSKGRMIRHSTLLSSYIHPWRLWCFMGEDFMRRVQKIGEASVRGLQATAVSTKMVSHYRLGMHLQLSGHIQKQI